jgi:hypothetical protein
LKQIDNQKSNSSQPMWLEIQKLKLLTLKLGNTFMEAIGLQIVSFD